MPTMFSPACWPLNVALVHTFCGSAAVERHQLVGLGEREDIARGLRRRSGGRRDGGVAHQLVGVEHA